MEDKKFKYEKDIDIKLRIYEGQVLPENIKLARLRKTLEAIKEIEEEHNCHCTLQLELTINKMY